MKSMYKTSECYRACVRVKKKCHFAYMRPHMQASVAPTPPFFNRIKWEATLLKTNRLVDKQLEVTVIPKRHPNIGTNLVFANFFGPNMSAAIQQNYFILAQSLRHLRYLLTYTKYDENAVKILFFKMDFLIIRTLLDNKNTHID